MTDSAPAAAPADRGDLKSTSYEFFMLAMAILSIANLPLLVIYPFKSESWYLVLFVEAAAMAQVPLAGTDWIPGKNG